MKKTSLVILLYCTLFTINGFSQKIKFRIDIGNSIGFCSYRQKMFSEYYQKPIATSEYTFTKLANNSLLSFPTKIGLSLEYEYKKRNHFTFGYFANEGLPLKDRIIYNYGPYGDSLGYRDALPWSHTANIEAFVHKINFTYSRDYGNGRIKISPFIGASYIWCPYKPNPFDTIATSGAILGKDDMFPSSDFYIKTTATFAEHTNSFMLSAGTNIRFYSKKRELFALKFYYEQGLRVITMHQVEVYRNSNHFYNNVYSRGSAFYIKLSVPIQIYDFEKHKKLK